MGRLLAKMLFPLAMCLFVSAVSASDSPSSNEANPIVISSEAMDYDTNTITVREGKKLMVSCVFESDEQIHKSDLLWKQANGNNIDGESNPSLFSVILNEKGSKHRKTSLHFSSVHTRDTGLYTCTGRTAGGENFEKTIKLVVLPAIEWNDKDTVKGALLGEPITIDCGVKGPSGKEPMIQMTNGNGEPLDEEIWTIAGNEATIDSLKKEHAELTVSCITIEMHQETSKEEFPVVDRKDVNIEVYTLPEFETEESVQYTVIDNHVRDAIIYCNVTHSFPPVRHYTFYHGDEEIKMSDKFNIFVNVGVSQGAHLKIHNVNENDLGTYKCEANNIKAKSYHTIHLREANAPAEPKVTLIEDKRHSIIWKVESIDRDPDLPMTAVEIRHLRAGTAEASGVSDEDISDAYWKSHSIFMQRNIKDDGIYEINGLRHGHEYVWRFRQINEAGFGDSVVLRAKTLDDHDLEMMDSASDSKFPLALATLFFVCLFI
ncbi:Neuronal immunoglobulin domain-containing protein rig-3 [Caenorhabditis elegans]|uniref:Neuronal immunoglobulin domain-containing protein rig-3 n=1 Tax=Caenorhabditis elegans TaxID=6239 RepID=RIG3_CAEEL|nr:Neuronal immunoglobulin domain-containing protein rig-3 [Caenorhabditis elegans]Q18806.1 RecName: Full=Neuronal immunoglobulin domain-containing protein rig-3; Flags: Precursor [Caenorhabditis elegans]CCD67885.1 Neuronal immunoglobulin domain-containing protein rig-3 [Caenorhabditis elegans]|eukprot:NP_509155.1 Neuronal immunoglobulin domain-containing protein rig-3 [Caenorhabditis elegans]